MLYSIIFNSICENHKHTIDFLLQKQYNEYNFINTEVNMSNITIYTDSTADISPAWLEQNNVKCIKLTYIIDDTEYYDDPDPSAIKEFYDKMREGKIAKTSAISIQTFLESFEEELKSGNDVVYTGLSGKLSATCNNAFMAMEQLNNKYSDNQVYVTDSISTACPLYHLISKAVDMRDSGKSAQEIVDTIDEMKHKLFAYASVDDLMHLKAATVGSILNIKPVLILDPDGSLVLKDKIKGNKKLFKYFLSKIEEYSEDPVEQTVYIIHSDALELAENLKDTIFKEFGTKNIVISSVGSIVGSHLGPGSLIISFPAKCTRDNIK